MSDGDSTQMWGFTIRWQFYMFSFNREMGVAKLSEEMKLHQIILGVNPVSPHFHGMVPIYKFSNTWNLWLSLIFSHDPKTRLKLRSKQAGDLGSRYTYITSFHNGRQLWINGSVGCNHISKILKMFRFRLWGYLESMTCSNFAWQFVANLVAKTCQSRLG